MSSTYISQIIEQVNQVIARCGPVFLYGENIDTGSRIAGLARGLQVNSSGLIRNVGNCELTHCGVGFGMMLDGGQAILFMKQQDFLLLGLDQLVNTYNFVRAYRNQGILGSFTIFLIACDQGYQGPQSSMNSASDIASLANIPVYCLNSIEDATEIVASRFVSPGFRLICVSQRLFGSAPLSRSVLDRTDDGAVFHRAAGDDVTLACFNFSLRQGVAIAELLRENALQTDLFQLNYVPGMDLRMVLRSCARTRKLVVLDDSKSVCKFGDILIRELAVQGTHVKFLPISRYGCDSVGYGVSDDQFNPDQKEIMAFVSKP